MNKPTLVLGASENPERYSNKAIKRLVSAGHNVYAIGARTGKVDDTFIQKDKQPLIGIHTVTIYLNAQNQKQYYDYVLQLNPERVIFNPGAENAEFEKMLEQKNIETMEACTLVMLSIGAF